MKIKKGLKAAYHLLLDGAARICARFSRLPERLWLVSERGFDARDNGFVFFRYLRERHPEIRALYVITPDSPDLPKVRAAGDWVAFGSFRHRVCMLRAEALISTHDCGFTPDMVLYHHLRKHGLFRPRGKIVMLQHGVIHQAIEWYFRSECTPDLFFSSSETEARIITGVFRQPESVVAVTGLPRFDLLDGGGEEKLVLVMPTWRKYLAGLDRRAFSESEYCRQFAALLADERLLWLLRETGYRLVFYPHVEMQRFYRPAAGKEISVATMETEDVQSLLRRCRVLITDYSSVFFDAAYMNKTILFFQFDRERYEAGHYSKSLIGFSGFGKICSTEDEVLEALTAAVTEKGGERNEREAFFKYHDKHNCDRVFRAIRERL